MTWTWTDTRDFLRSRNAVLAHFSTVMSSHDHVYPEDLKSARDNTEWTLSFSTVQPGDTLRYHQGGKGGVQGSVGLIVGITSETIVHSVFPGDAGAMGTMALGDPPSLVVCSDSIDKRDDYNEWRVSRFRPVGILVVGPPFMVRKLIHYPELAEIDPSAAWSKEELPIDLASIVSDFNGMRIFRACKHSFCELIDSGWRDVSVAEMTV